MLIDKHPHQDLPFGRRSIHDEVPQAFECEVRREYTFHFFAAILRDTERCLHDSSPDSNLLERVMTQLSWISQDCNAALMKTIFERYLHVFPPESEIWSSNSENQRVGRTT